MESTVYDRKKAAALARQVGADFGASLTVALAYVGDRLGIFRALAGLRRVLKPHGALLWSEAEVSDRLEDNLDTFGRTLYGASTMHCLTVSLAQHGEGLGSAIGENLARSLAGGWVHEVREAADQESVPPSVSCPPLNRTTRH
jgi:hypothetical protein